MDFVSTKQIKTFPVNEEFTGYLRVVSLRTKETSSGKKYLDMILGDKYGNIPTKIWELPFATFGESDVIEFTAVYDTYHDMPQLAIQPNMVQKIELDKLSEDDRKEVIANIMPVATCSKNDLQKYLHDTILGVQDSEYKAICIAALKKYHPKGFSTAAAALMYHDACVSGLLVHTVKVIQYALAIFSSECQMPLNKNVPINRDLLITGALLHDLLKLEEYKFDEYGIATGHTMFGNLIGHLPGTLALVRDLCEELKFDTKSEKIVLLMHLLLSHHGKPEQGSPVEPLCAEAVILHMADDMAAKVSNILSIEETLEEGEFTEKTFESGKRYIYRPHTVLPSARLAKPETKEQNKSEETTNAKENVVASTTEETVDEQSK